MKTAKELTAMANAHNEAVIAQTRAEALDTLERKIYPQMEHAANEGRFGIKYHTDCGLAADVVIDELIKNGYSVRRNGLWLSIEWPMFEK